MVKFLFQFRISLGFGGYAEVKGRRKKKKKEEEEQLFIEQKN